MGGQQQQPPSYSRYASELMNMQPERITGKTALDLAIQKGFPRPSEAADAVMKIVDSDRKRLKESLPNQPTGTTPLDVPMANMIRDVSGLDYLQAAPIQAPLGMQGNLPMTIQDIIPMLPPDYQLPSPIQGQQPELSLFGPGALNELPSQVTHPYVASDIVEKVMAARTRQPDITSYPSGTETKTVLRDPITGMPKTDIATAPRQLLTPQQEAFGRLSPAEQKEALLKAQVEIRLPSPGERKDLVDVGERKDMLQNFKTSFEGAKTSLGPAQGRLKYLQYVKGGGIGLSAAEISYFANEATITNRVIKLITGAAVGVKEEKRIMSEIPRHTDTPAQWEVKYQATLKNAADLEGRIKKTMKDYGIDSPSNAPTGTIEWQ